MNKYTRRRMVAWSALLAVIGVGGLEIVKDKSDDLSNVVTQDVYAAYEETETTVATSGRTATFNTAATSMSTLSTTSTTYEVTTTEPACYYTELLRYCGNTWGNTELYLTEYEVELLSTLVYLEGGGESFECQKNIASTVINRMLTSDYTLSEILYANNQYSVASRLAYSSPSESNSRRACAAIRTSSSVSTWEKLNRTAPCSRVPSASCISGAQCAPLRTAIP